MNVGKWLDHASEKLDLAGIGTARLDSLILLEDELGKDRTNLLAYPETVISRTRQKRLDSRLKRRLKHLPMAQIRGFSEFYGRRFKINRHVLEPRPESEAMIELLKQLADSEQRAADSRWKIVDVGTGSGCLAITAKLEIPKAEVIATDTDLRCLKVARQNDQVHKTGIRFYRGDLLKPLPSTVYGLPSTVLLANMPYVPDRWKINQAAAMEPRIAIFGGRDGLDVYRRLFKQISSSTWKPKYLLTESLPPQHEKLSAIANDHGYRLTETRDFIQLFVTS